MVGAFCERSVIPHPSIYEKKSTGGGKGRGESAKQRKNERGREREKGMGREGVACKVVLNP